MGWNVILQELVREKGGVFERAEAAERGVPSSAIDQQARQGAIVAIHPGVYRSTAVEPSLVVRQRAALRAAGPDSVLSHRSAGKIHEMTPSSTFDRVDILVPHHRRFRLAGVDVHRTMRLPSSHIREIDGLRLTTVDRTLADLGSVVGSVTVALAMERAVIDRLTTIDRLYRFVDEHGQRGRSGIGALRAALDDWVLSDRPPDSALEVVFARLVRNAGLPEPLYRHEIWEGRRLVARVDAAWPDYRLVVEVDGFHHHSTAVALQHDNRRQNAIVRLGWQIQRFEWLRVVRRPSTVVDDIRAFLDSREPGRA